MSNIPRQFRSKNKKNNKLSIDKLRSSLRLVPKRANDIPNHRQAPPAGDPNLGAQPNMPKNMPIDFSDKILPKTILIDVETQTVKVGNETDMMKDIPVLFTVSSSVNGGVAFLNFLRNLTTDQVEKVILDKRTQFVIKTLAEFTEDILRYVANPAVASGKASRSLPQVDDMLVERRVYTQAESDAAIGMLDASRKITSNAQWPQDSTFGPIADSSDTHDTYSQAASVCNMLENQGFGGGGVVFPIRTWVDYAK